MTKYRAVQFIVQPVVVADDGENLTAEEIQQYVVSAADFAAFPEQFFAALAEKSAD